MVSEFDLIPRYVKFAGENVTNEEGLIFFGGHVPVGKMVVTVRFPNALGKPFMMYESGTYGPGAKIYSNGAASSPYARQTVTFEGYYLE